MTPYHRGSRTEMATVKVLDGSCHTVRKGHGLSRPQSCLCCGFPQNQLISGCRRGLCWGKYAAPCPGLQAEAPEGFRDRDRAKTFGSAEPQGPAPDAAGLEVFPLPQEGEMWLSTA